MKLHLIGLTLITAALALPNMVGAADKKAADVPVGSASPAPAGAATKQKSDRVPFRGKISAVDKDAKTVSLEGKEGTRVFAVTETTRLRKGDGAATWDDIKVGEEVGGQYKKSDDGKMEILTLRVGPKAEKKAKSEASAEAPKQ